MHELPVTEEILKIVLRYARRHGVTEVKKVYLEIGALSDLEEEWIQTYFQKCAAGTVAAGAIIEVTKLHLCFSCRGCDKEFSSDLQGEGTLVCPDCGGTGVHLISGDEYRVKSMEAI